MVQIRITSATVLTAVMASIIAAPAYVNEHKLAARSPAPPTPQIVVDLINNKAPGKAKREPEPHGRLDSVVGLAGAASNVYHTFKGKREPGSPPVPQAIVNVIDTQSKAKREPGSLPAPQVVVDVINNKPKAKREPGLLSVVPDFNRLESSYKPKIKREPAHDCRAPIRKGKREPEPGIGSFFKGVFGGKRRDLEARCPEM